MIDEVLTGMQYKVDHFICFNRSMVYILGMNVCGVRVYEQACVVEPEAVDTIALLCFLHGDGAMQASMVFFLACRA